jgi:hypothetical protein
MAKPKAKNKRKQAQAAVAKAAPPTRRNFLAYAPYVAVGALVVGGLGVWGTSAVQADLAEQDLSIIGDGVPTIVQVHDPTCPICTALQKEARAALDDIDTGALEYRIANIKNDVGSAFATLHGSSHATLLFFDSAGNLTQRVQGATPREELYDAFMAHIARDS